MGQAEEEIGPTLRFTDGSGRGRKRPDPTMDHRSGRLPFGGLTDNSGRRRSNVIRTFFTYGSGRERNRPDPAIHLWGRPRKKPARPYDGPPVGPLGFWRPDR